MHQIIALFNNHLQQCMQHSYLVVLDFMAQETTKSWQVPILSKKSGTHKRLKSKNGMSDVLVWVSQSPPFDFEKKVTDAWRYATKNRANYLYKKPPPPPLGLGFSKYCAYISLHDLIGRKGQDSKALNSPLISL